MLLQILLFLFNSALVPESQASCRTLEFRTTVNGKSLTNHTIRTIQPIKDVHTCRTQCYLEPLCFAVNFCQKDGSEAVCELLNNTATVIHDEDLVDKQECTFHNSESSCSSSPCPSNASCHGDFLMDPLPYKCICPAGFTGKFCESDINECAPNAGYCHEDATCNNSIGSYSCRCKNGYHGNGKTCQEIDECESNTHNCDAKAICNNTIGGFTCTCKPGLLGNGTFCRYPENCEDIFGSLPNSEDGYYNFKTADGSLVERLCVFTASQECGVSSWTLALKIDGSKAQYAYSSTLWTGDSAINANSYKTAFEGNKDIKLPAFWDHPIDKLCLGMKNAGVLKWISVTISGSSLRSLFASGQERPTNVTRVKWKSLINQARLQSNCNKEGVNMRCGWYRTRIGIIANNENDCVTCDSILGLGLTTRGCGHSHNNKKTYPICFILVQ